MTPSPGLTDAAPSMPPSVRHLLARPLTRLAAIYAVIVLAFAVTADGFLTVDNALNIGRAGAIPGIAAVGIAVAMISGSIDVSFASVISVAGVIAAEQLDGGRGVAVAIVAGLLVGLVLGLVNGLIARILDLDAMIVTIGTLSIYSGWIFMRTNGVPVRAPSDAFASLGRGDLVGVPAPLVAFVLVAVAAGALMRFTTFGQHCYLVGDNIRAAELVGLPARRIRIWALGISGLTAGAAGILLAANAGVANPGSGSRFLLPALAAVVVGGVSLAGGRGGILGVVLGVALLGTIDNGLNLLQVSSTWQDVIRGLIIIVGLVLDRIRRVRA